MTRQMDIADTLPTPIISRGKTIPIALGNADSDFAVPRSEVRTLDDGAPLQPQAS